MKKGTVPVKPYLAVSEDDKAWFRLHSLRQDFEDLLKDTEAKKRKLEGAKQRALKLKGEIRFLRKKYKVLTQTASPIPNHSKSLKRKGKATNSFQTHQDRILSAGEATPSKSTPILDLNQVSQPDGNEEVDFQIPSESRYKVSSSQVGSSRLKTPICRDEGSSNGQRGKRKVSWQDPVVLKV